MILCLYCYGIVVYGVMIILFIGLNQVYGYLNREVMWQRVNKWICESGKFDVVFDFDEVIWDFDQFDMLLLVYDFGDYFYFNFQGFKVMVELIDLMFFDQS